MPLKGITNSSTSDHMEALATSRNSYCNELKDQGKEVLGSVLKNMDRLIVRVVRSSIDWKTSGWLTVLPLSVNILTYLLSSFKMCCL